MWIITIVSLLIFLIPLGFKIRAFFRRLRWEADGIERARERKAKDAQKPELELDLSKTIPQERELIVEVQRKSERVRIQNEFVFDSWIKQQRQVIFDNTTSEPKQDNSSRESGDEEIEDIITQEQIDKEIQALASAMLSEAKDRSREAADFWRLILQNGGIARYRNGHEDEEYERNVPKWYRRKRGLPPDEMASVMGYENDQELYSEIAKYEEVRKQKNLKLRDFMVEASMSIGNQYGTLYDDSEIEFSEVPF